MRIEHMPRLGGLMVTTFGLGLLRPAPGTWGSLPPVMVAGLLLILGASPHHTVEGWEWGRGAWLTFHGVLAAIVVVFSLACMMWGNEAEAAFGKKDPGSVCADETAGMSVALMFLPAEAVSPSWAVWTLLLAFLCFRMTDILKLPPARGVQRVPGGLGILVDDLVAGIQAMIAVQIVVRAWILW